ncbi:putative zinc transporter [Glycine max]|nr:putative zinc transporter [Glycine max]
MREVGADATIVVLVPFFWCLKGFLSWLIGNFGYCGTQHSRGIGCEHQGASILRMPSLWATRVCSILFSDEASASQVASAATLSVAFMEALSTLFQNFNRYYNSKDAFGFFVSLFFGPGGIFLVGFALSWA